MIPVGERAKTCLQELPRAPTPPVIRKFLNDTRPEPGAIRVLRGKADDPDVASSLVHGVSTKSSLSVSPAQLDSFCQQKLLQLSEAVYASSRKAPLGRSHDQSGRLPNWYNDKTTFGVKSLKGLSAREVVNPPKTTEEVEREAQEGHQAYIRSHNAYFVGERVDRNYSWSRCAKDSRFGVSVPHSHDGRSVAKSLQWLGETWSFLTKSMYIYRFFILQVFLVYVMLSLHFCVFRTANTPSNRAFGLMLPPDEHGAGDLIHCAEPGQYPSGRDRRHTLVSAVRNLLKKVNFHNFPSLLQAFRHYDKKGRGMIDKEDLLAVCREVQLDLCEPILSDLMDDCDADKDSFINFVEFANFLTWKDKMPINTREQDILTKCRNSTAPAGLQRELSSDSADAPDSRPLIQPEDLQPVKPGSSQKTVRTLSRPKTVPHHFSTSSSLIGAVAGDPTSCFHGRTFGIPTIRTDLPAPRIKRICDTNNYGDTETAADLLYPSLHSLYGAHKEHFFCPRSRDEMAQIFENMGVSVSKEIFEEAWRLASMRHPTGEVCVEVFRNVLKEIKAM
uniref:EF-hand domain family, member B n=1 Tax=Myripristis murdjan TaxID=586833 RepID=A0A667X6Z5_9TELE